MKIPFFQESKKFAYETIQAIYNRTPSLYKTVSSGFPLPSMLQSPRNFYAAVVLSSAAFVAIAILFVRSLKGSDPSKNLDVADVQMTQGLDLLFKNAIGFPVTDQRSPFYNAENLLQCCIGMHGKRLSDGVRFTTGTGQAAYISLNVRCRETNETAVFGLYQKTFNPPIWCLDRSTEVLWKIPLPPCFKRDTELFANNQEALALRTHLQKLMSTGQTSLGITTSITLQLTPFQIK